MEDVLAIAKRELRYLWTDRRLRTVVFIAPFLYAGLFCAIYSGHTLNDVRIAIVQEDSSAAARTLVRMLGSSTKLAIVRRATSADELRDLIFDNTVDAAIVIPHGFADKLKRGRDVAITAYVNAQSMVTANTAAKAINEIVQTFSAGVEIRTLMKKGDRLEDAKQHFMPVKLDLRSLFNPSFNYSNFMIPGLLMAILQQVILLGVALSWTGEKEAGRLPELLRTSRSPWTLLAGKMLPYFVINAVVAEFYLRVLFPLNDIPMEGSWLVAIPFTFLFVITVVSWGTWVSALCKSRLFATQLLMFVAMPSFVLSGFTWPAQAMPAWVQAVAQFLPLTHFVNSFRSIYLGGAPFQYVWRDFAALLLFSTINVAVSYGLVKRELTSLQGAERRSNLGPSPTL